ncbi:UNVERIFIED_CONTAM: UDP-glycosyltransferase 86A1 [Sesamum latifolium]|uniref:UDP-glycosyltransferase 86A1 n=1 Tax=Sesamum latifolium TaxID=2727402 RepID=A0AAW2XRD0_9LAMI
MAHAIVIPYPYQGHVTPMINLSIRLASRGFTVTFVQTEFIHRFMSKARNLPADDFDLFAEAQKSGLDIRYTTFSDGFRWNSTGTSTMKSIGRLCFGIFLIVLMKLW